MKGKVTEESSGNAVMFAHVFLKSLQVGTTTDTSGHFKLIINDQKKPDTLIVSFLGYYTEKMVVVPDTTQTISIKLKAQFTQLHDVVINAGTNPAWAVVEQVIENKKNNNPETQSSYTCEEYSKIRFDLNHFNRENQTEYYIKAF